MGLFFQSKKSKAIKTLKALQKIYHDAEVQNDIMLFNVLHSVLKYASMEHGAQDIDKAIEYLKSQNLKLYHSVIQHLLELKVRLGELNKPSKRKRMDLTPTPLVFSHENISSQLKKIQQYPRYRDEEKYREYQIKIDDHVVRIGAGARLDEVDQGFFKIVRKDYDVLISLAELEKKAAYFCEQDTEYKKCYIDDWHAASQEQFDELINIFLDAAEKGKSIMIHCGSGCGRTGHVICALMMYAKINAMSLGELENYNFDNVRVPVEKNKNYAGIGTPLIREVEKEVRKEMCRPDGLDCPIENEAHLDALKQLEIRLVNKLIAQKRQKLEH